MRTRLLLIVPAVLLVGLILAVYGLKGFIRGDVPCVVGTCPSVLYEGDAGRTFVYSVGTRFSIMLDERKNPSRDLVCSPTGVIKSVTDTPLVQEPLYAVVFQGIAAGSCQLVSNSFTATINIVSR